MKQSHYDVAIIGSGIAGTMLGAILANQKLNVVIIDAVPILALPSGNRWCRKVLYC